MAEIAPDETPLLSNPVFSVQNEDPKTIKEAVQENLT